MQPTKKVPICAPLHDALFAVAPADEEQAVTDALLACMNRASKDVIGVVVPTEVEVVRFPNRFVPTKKPEAIQTWAAMMEALERLESKETENERPVLQERMLDPELEQMVERINCGCYDRDEKINNTPDEPEGTVWRNPDGTVVNFPQCP